MSTDKEDLILQAIRTMNDEVKGIRVDINQLFSLVNKHQVEIELIKQADGNCREIRARDNADVLDKIDEVRREMTATKNVLETRIKTIEEAPTKKRDKIGDWIKFFGAGVALALGAKALWDIITNQKS